MLDLVGLAGVRHPNATYTWYICLHTVASEFVWQPYAAINKPRV